MNTCRECGGRIYLRVFADWAPPPYEWCENGHVQEIEVSKNLEQAEILDSEEEWTANERRLALMLQCSEAALNKTKAEAKFAQDYPREPWDCESL